MKKTIRPQMFRSRQKSVIKFLVVFALFFFFYQFGLVLFLDRSQSKTADPSKPDTLKSVPRNPFAKPPPRGVLPSDAVRYRPDGDLMFACFDGGRRIPFSHVNDDYCDCPEDGSDEPGTNACNAGRFHCETQPQRGEPRSVPSHRVNDGICDCCDGSDEWKQANLTDRLSIATQRRIGTFQPPCVNRC